MGRYVRPGDRKHHRTTVWAAAVLVVLVTAALAVVLPAVGSDTSTTGGVAPASGLHGVLPSIADVGGSNFDCNKAGESYGGPATPSGMRKFQISKATPGSYTDPATGVKFVVSASPGKDPKSHLDFGVSGTMSGAPVVVYHVGVKGGTKVSWYDYYNNASHGVSSDTNLHSSPDSQYNANAVPPKSSFNVASITTFCYGLPTVTPSCTAPFDGHAFGGGVEYSAQLLDEGNGCKTDDVVMYTSKANGNRFATLHPVTGGGTYKVVEHIAWRGFGHGQNPITLWYDDTAPYDGVDQRNMLLCKRDPRVHPINPFALPVDVEDANVLPDVLPGDTKGAHTSCMLESTDSAPASDDTDPSRAYSAWIYSKVDGSRGGFNPG